MLLCFVLYGWTGGHGFNDAAARTDWGWSPRFELNSLADDFLGELIDGDADSRNRGLSEQEVGQQQSEKDQSSPKPTVSTGNVGAAGSGSGHEVARKAWGGGPT